MELVASGFIVLLVGLVAWTYPWRNKPVDLDKLDQDYLPESAQVIDPKTRKQLEVGLYTARHMHFDDAEVEKLDNLLVTGRIREFTAEAQRLV